MQKLEVLIEENAFGDVRPVEVVADAPVGALVPALVEELQLPQTDLFGKKLVYTLRYGSDGYILPPNATLLTCGVGPGARLALDSRAVDIPNIYSTQAMAPQQPASPAFYSSSTMTNMTALPTNAVQNTSGSLPITGRKRRWSRRAALLAGGTAVGLGGIGLVYAAYHHVLNGVPLSVGRTSSAVKQQTRPTSPQPALPSAAKPIFSFTGHQQTVRVVAWSPDGMVLASGADDTQLLVWTPQGNIQQRIMHPAPVHAVGWSPDRQRIVTGSANQIAFYNIVSGTLLARSTHRHASTITSLAWSPLGKQQVVSGALDMRAIVWDTTRYQAVEVFTRHTAPIESVAWAADGLTVASSSQGGAVRVWLSTNGQEVHGAYQDAQIPMRTAAFAPVGMQLAVGGDDGLVRLWNGLTCKQQAPGRDGLLCMDMPVRLQATNKPVRALAWSPDGRLLAAGGNDGVVVVWAPAQGLKSLFTIQAHGPVHSLSWSPTNRQLAVAAGNSVTLWDMQ